MPTGRIRASDQSAVGPVLQQETEQERTREVDGERRPGEVLDTDGQPDAVAGEHAGRAGDGDQERDHGFQPMAREHPDPDHAAVSDAERAADDLLHDLGGPSVDRHDPGVAGTCGRSGTPPCSRSHRGAARSVSTTRLHSSVVHHFASAAVSAESVRSLSASSWRSTNTRAMSISVRISASLKRLCWKLPMGWPNASRSLA